jgi:hypothetical protein
LIYITHDIDWVSPLHPYSVVKAFTHGKKWLGLHKIVQPNIFVNHIEKLIRFNNDHDIYPVWLTGAPLKHSYQKFGLRYTADCSVYKKIIHILNESDAEIGLHSVNSESLPSQVNALIALTGKPLNYHRSHYLKYDENTLFRSLQYQGIKTDFSLGNARKVGMPAQVPFVTYGVNCVPTVLFDNAFFFYPAEDVFRQFRQSLTEASQAGKDMAVLFHPENFAVNPALWEYYKETLAIVKSITGD